MRKQLLSAEKRRPKKPPGDTPTTPGKVDAGDGVKRTATLWSCCALVLISGVVGAQESIVDFGYMGHIDLRRFDPKAKETGPEGAVVDVLVVNSRQRSAAHNPAVLESINREQIEDVTAMALQRSEVPHRFRLAGSVPVSWDESLDENDGLSDDLLWLNDNPEVAALRESYRADMVLLAVQDFEEGAAGRAWLGAAAGYSNGVFASPERAGNRVAAHELGHLMGAWHDTLDDGDSGFPIHGHAWLHPQGESRRSIMAVTCLQPPCRTYFGYSNPDLVDEEGIPTGVAGVSNVAALLRDVMPQVAQYSNGRSSVCSYLRTTYYACLHGGRFAVFTNWRDFESRIGGGTVVPARSQNSAIFSFFDTDNWELLVKVLDGCELNGHYWVFYAAATNVEFGLVVEDRLTGTRTVYQNALGQRAHAVTDTLALGVCP